MEQVNLTHAAFSEAIRDVQDAASRLHHDRDRIDDRVSGYLGSGWPDPAKLAPKFKDAWDYFLHHRP